MAISINAVTLVSGGLLSLAEQKAAMSDKTNNMMGILTCDRIINVLQLDCPLNVLSWYNKKIRLVKTKKQQLRFTHIYLISKGALGALEKWTSWKLWIFSFQIFVLLTWIYSVF